MKEKLRSKLKTARKNLAIAQLAFFATMCMLWLITWATDSEETASGCAAFYAVLAGLWFYTREIIPWYNRIEDIERRLDGRPPINWVDPNKKECWLFRED